MAVISASSLPPFDSLEVVDLGGTMGDEARERLSGQKPAKRAHVTGADAQRMGELFRALPPGEQARCHLPPFGFVFYLGPSKIGWASICWKCNNVQGQIGQDPIVCQFDSSAKIARELLAACKSAMSSSR